MQLSDLTQEQLDAIGREVCRRLDSDTHLVEVRQNPNEVLVVGNCKATGWYVNEPLRLSEALAILAELEERDATL